MIVRITNCGNRHYGIVYKLAENFGRHQILMLKDKDGVGFDEVIASAVDNVDKTDD